MKTVAGETSGAHHLRFRRRRVLRRIAAQHLRLDEMADAVIRSIEEADAATAHTSLARFTDAICAHFAMEEDVDFPALVAFDPELRAELGCLSADHSAIVESLATVDDTLAGASRAVAHRAFDQLARVIEAHEVREERLLDSVT